MSHVQLRHQNLNDASPEITASIAIESTRACTDLILKKHQETLHSVKKKGSKLNHEKCEFFYIEKQSLALKIVHIIR